MNTELKPGMMALVIGSKNEGKIVTLIENALNGHRANKYSTFSGSDDGWFVVGGDLFAICNGIEVLRDFSYIRSKHLMPIKPQADPLHIKEEQHASA